MELVEPTNMSPADAGCLVSLIKNLELQLSLGDVEELVKLMKNISNEITRETGATTKPRNSVRASLSKNVDQTKFGSLGNAFAIIFVEVFEVGTLAACDWEIIETALECIVAAKHVRDFELLDWVQEEEARKAREAEALKEKENAEKAEQEKLKQQHIMRLQEIREVKKQCERDEAKLVATCRESSSSHYVDGAPKPADLFRGDTPEMKKPKNDYHAKVQPRYEVSPGKKRWMNGKWYRPEEIELFEKCRRETEARIAANRAAALARRDAMAQQKR